MRFRVGVPCGGAIFGATLFLACFPDYKFSDHAGENDGGGEAGDAKLDGDAAQGQLVDGGMILIPASDASFSVPVALYDGGADISPTRELSHSFLLDATEVTVGRFNAWIAADTPGPCASGGVKCPLDPNGPYDAQMFWDPSWNAGLVPRTWEDANCRDGDPVDSGIGPTFGRNPNFPVTCVNWFQAVAFCAFEGKRLPTETEWRFAATNLGRQLDFGFWSKAGTLGCDTVIHRADENHCGFPVPVGSAPNGVTAQGIYDLAGSVFEWQWDWFGEPLPGFARDYTGAPSGTERVRPGGSYISGISDGALHSNSREAHPPGEFYSDAGFRCAKTVL